MDLDVMERARCGDREAYRAVVAAWGDRVLRTAALLGGDRARAHTAVVGTFLRAWHELPTLHSERPFRPWLMRALLAAIPEDPGEEDDRRDPAIDAIDALDDEQRELIVLHLYDQMGATELALVHGTNLGVAARALRTALRALTAAGSDEQQAAASLTEHARSLELPPWFFEETVAPRLAEPDGPTVRRLVAIDPDAAWGQLLDPASIPRWVRTEDVRVRGVVRLEPGARIQSSGRIAGRRPSRDETVITRAEPHTLAWTTRSRIKPWPSAIEFRWTLTLAPSPAGCEIVHTLRGVAFPPGAGARFLRAAYERVSDAMPGSMHAGIEQLAQLLEAGARRTAL